MINEKHLEKYQAIESVFTKNNVRDTLEEIANVLAPSQTVMATRAPVVEGLIKGYNLPNIKFDPDYLGTGNAMFSSNKSQPSILFIAHLDQISYLVDEKISDKVWRLLPYCKHLSQIEVPAKALRYNLDNERYEVSAEGIIYSEGTAENLTPYFRASKGALESGDRVVYEWPVQIEGDLARGNIDNAAGAAACLVAGSALFKAFPESNVGFVFSDEEEGPSDNPMFFARGVRRLMNKMPTPDVCIIIDGHGGRGGKDIGQGTFFTEKTADGQATVTPPVLFRKIKALANELHPLGIDMFEDLGRVSRSDDIPCLAVTPNVISIGYPSVNRHHDQGPPVVSLKDLENLAKAIFWIGMTLGSNDE